MACVVLINVTYTQAHTFPCIQNFSMNYILESERIHVLERHNHHHCRHWVGWWWMSSWLIRPLWTKICNIDICLILHWNFVVVESFNNKHYLWTKQRFAGKGRHSLRRVSLYREQWKRQCKNTTVRDIDPLPISTQKIIT